FFQAEDGIRDFHVTGVQTCALPISLRGGTVVIRNEKRKQLIRFEGIAAAVNGVTIPALAGGDGGDAGRGSAELTTRLIMDDYERSEERRVGTECRSRRYEHYSTEYG